MAPEASSVAHLLAGSRIDGSHEAAVVEDFHYLLGSVRVLLDAGHHACPALVSLRLGAVPELTIRSQ
jgi:hypothetical protein